MANEIKPRYVDGEPECNGIECPDHPGRGHRDCCHYAEFEEPDECIPALRRDRDKWKALYETLIEQSGKLRLCEDCTRANEGIMVETETALLCANWTERKEGQ